MEKFDKTRERHGITARDLMRAYVCPLVFCCVAGGRKCRSGGRKKNKYNEGARIRYSFTRSNDTQQLGRNLLKRRNLNFDGTQFVSPISTRLRDTSGRYFASQIRELGSLNFLFPALQLLCNFRDFLP